jgi:hypothetical protein
LYPSVIDFAIVGVDEEEGYVELSSLARFNLSVYVLYQPFKMALEFYSTVLAAFLNQFLKSVVHLVAVLTPNDS